jgi:hypothetical protein
MGDPTLRDEAAKDGAPGLWPGWKMQVPPLRCASVGMTRWVLVIRGGRYSRCALFEVLVIQNAPGP